MKETIYKRKSFRSYNGIDLSIDEKNALNKQIQSLVPLYENPKILFQVVSRKEVNSMFPWLPANLIAVYAEDAPFVFENVGFMLQQLDLFLQKEGLGSCWIGIGKPKEITFKGLPFRILLAFGHSNETYRTSPEDFKRKPLCDISDEIDPRLEPARLAPSSINSQPWYFTHESGRIRIWLKESKRLLSLGLKSLNHIDIGIALAHLFVSNPETFRWLGKEETVDESAYIGSIQL